MDAKMIPIIRVSQSAKRMAHGVNLVCFALSPLRYASYALTILLLFLNPFVLFRVSTIGAYS